MLNRIIKFSLDNRLFIIVAAILLMTGGVYTMNRTEVDVFPDLNAPTVVIMTEAGGMAAEEVEQLVTFPIETAVNGATGVRRVILIHHRLFCSVGGIRLGHRHLSRTPDSI